MLIQKRVGDRTFNISVEGNGDPIVFVHGFPLDHSMWADQIDAFRSSYCVISPDLRGFGSSDGGDEIVRMKDFASDLQALLEVLDVRAPVHLCGLSMGGYIAFQFAKYFGERLKSLILCDTKAAADSAEAKQTRYDTAERVLKDGSDFLAEAMPQKLFSPKTFQSFPNIVRSTQNVIRRTDPRSIAAASRGMAERPDMTSELSHLSVPTLVIVGEDDAITPVNQMDDMASRIPSAKFVKVANAGHMAPLENPEVVNQAISKFLNSLRS